jgi:hypothetical protein
VLIRSIREIDRPDDQQLYNFEEKRESSLGKGIGEAYEGI